MRRTTIAAAALLAASSLALAPAAHADTATGPGGKIQVTTAGTSIGSLFGNLSVHPGAHGSREVTMVNASADTAILTVRAAVPASIDSALSQGLSLCWLGGDRTFGSLAGTNTVVGTALLAPGESTKASFGYRFGEDSQQPAAGASTGFTLNFNLRQAVPGEKPGAVEGGGTGCGSADDWKTVGSTAPAPGDKPGNPNPGKPDVKPGNPGKPAPGDKPGNPTPGKPSVVPPTAGGPDVVLPGDPSPTAVPTDHPKPPAPGDPEGPGDPKPSIDGNPAGGQGSKPDTGTAPVAGKDDAPDKLVVAGANTLIASILGAGMIGVGAWLVARRRRRQA